MTEDDLNSIRAAHLDGRPDSTHWGECHLAHPHCAIAVLLREVQQLQAHVKSWGEHAAEKQAEVTKLQATIERYLEAVTSGEDSTAAWDELVQTVW